MRKALLIPIALAATLARCGNVKFIVSPYTPQNVQIFNSITGSATGERLTIVTWQLGSYVDPSAVRFELLLHGQWTAIDFADAPYPAGQFPCSSGTCFQYNFPGQFPDPQQPLNVPLLRAVHPEQGILLGSIAFPQTVDPTLNFNPRLRSGNQVAELNVSDVFAQVGAPAPRQFRWQIVSMSPICPRTTATWAGVTSGPVVPFTGMLAPDLTPAADTRHLDNGDACLLIQPVVQKSFTGRFTADSMPFSPVTLSQELPAHPLLIDDSTHLDVPSEKSPVLYEILYSLDIPDEMLCESTIAQIDSIIGTAFDARNAEHHEFTAVNLAASGSAQCTGNPNHSVASGGPFPFDGAATAQMINDYVDTQVGESAGARVVFVYVANGSLAPTWVSEELGLLTSALVPRAQAFFWAISTPAALGQIVVGSDPQQTSLTPQATIPWTPPTDPAFLQNVTAFANQTLPFMSTSLSVNDMFPLLAPRFQGIANTYTTWLKICSYSPADSIILTDDQRPLDLSVMDGGYYSQLEPNDNYQFEVNLGTQLLMPFSQYRAQSADIRYELCTDYCSDNFQNPAGEWFGPWADDQHCGGSP